VYFGLVWVCLDWIGGRCPMLIVMIVSVEMTNNIGWIANKIHSSPMERRDQQFQHDLQSHEL
jgi:hypothetical protein